MVDKMAIKIKGSGLTIEGVVRVARQSARIEIGEETIRKISKYRGIVDKMVADKAIVYGVTTGIGELANVVLNENQIKDFQKYLVYSHSAGWGEPLPLDDVRAAMVCRTNILAKGYSGARSIVVETLAEMLNKGVTPVIYEKGSLGSSGDLAPLAQMALVPLGKGEAFYKGERMPGDNALGRAGIKAIEYEAKDGLAVINGSTLIAARGCLEYYDADVWIKTSEIAAAMTIEALKGIMVAFDERIQKSRGFEGAVKCAENVRRIVDGSEILLSPESKVQDAYSLRSTPQVIGAAKDALEYCKKQLEIEINGAADNPLFFLDNGGTYLTCANWQGTPIAFPLELLGMSITTLCVLSERRLNRLLDPKINSGLPGFLTKGAGMFSGLMVSQYTAAALVCENRILSTPACTGSIPVSAQQEDFVSMGATTAIKTRDILDNANAILAIELLAAAQALEFRRPSKPGKGTMAAYRAIRKCVRPLEEDRPLYPDIEALTKLVKNGVILKEVENAIGALK